MAEFDHGQPSLAAIHLRPAVLNQSGPSITIWKRTKILVISFPSYAELTSRRIPKTAPTLTQSESEASPMWAERSLPKIWGFAESVERTRRHSQGRPSILRR